MLFFRGIGALCILPWMLKTPRVSFKMSSVGLICVRSLASLLSGGLLYVSVQWIPLMNATLLLNTAPIFIPFIARMWLGVPLNHKLWIPISIGFVGIICILQPKEELLLNLGILCGLGSGIFGGISLLTARRTAHREKITTALFYTFLIGWIAIAPFALWDWKIASFFTLLALVGMGLLIFIGQWLLFKSLQFGTASHLAPFGYASVVYAGVFDWVFYDLVPGFLTVLGVAFVVFSGLVLLKVTKPKPPT